VGRTHFRRIGVSHDWDLLRMRYIGGTVPALAVGIFRVNLNYLGEIAAVAEGRGDCGFVRRESISADLEALRCGVRTLPNSAR
jgi:hypothetical protein